MHEQAKDSLKTDTQPLIKQAVWCGCVFSLAALITVLNCLPPVGIHFRVRAQVIASTQRIAALQAAMRTDGSSRVTLEDSGIQLYSLALLDQVRTPGEVSFKENLKLVEVCSRWNERTTTASVLAWLQRISQVPEIAPIDDSVQQQHRVAKWRSEAAAHYLAHHLHTSANNTTLQTAVSSDTSGTTIEASRLAAKNPMRLVGIARPEGESPSQDGTSGTISIDEVNSSEAQTNNPVRQKLEENLDAARAEAQRAAEDRQKMAAHAAGTLTITGAPEIRAEPGSMPLWLASSVLVFAVACGSSAGWVQHRLQSGGAFEPEAVAKLLEANGLAVVDRLRLSDVIHDSEDWLESTGRKATKLSRRLACGLTGISECVVMLWCGGIIMRFFLDPLWRHVFIESPLTALSRLIIGLP